MSLHAMARRVFAAVVVVDLALVVATIAVRGWSWGVVVSGCWLVVGAFLTWRGLRRWEQS